MDRKYDIPKLFVSFLKRNILYHIKKINYRRILKV